MMDTYTIIKINIYNMHALITALNVKTFPIFNYIKLWSTKYVQVRIDGSLSFPNNNNMMLYIPGVKYENVNNYTFEEWALILNECPFMNCDETDTLTAFTFKTNFILLTIYKRPDKLREDMDYIFSYKL